MSYVKEEVKMIASISFEKQLYLPMAEADALKLKYDAVDVTRIGIQSGVLSSMYSTDKYTDELIYDETNKRYTTADGEKISNYSVYTRPDRDDYVKVEQYKQLVDLDWFAERCKYRYYIEQVVKQPKATSTTIQSLLNALEEKIQAVDAAIGTWSQQTFNQKCNVHVGGGLIAQFNDLMLKEDCCTDELQTEINNGWRIIAVCVQANQRRPDYILGRYNPQLEVYDKNCASR